MSHEPMIAPPPSRLMFTGAIAAAVTLVAATIIECVLYQWIDDVGDLGRDVFFSLGWDGELGGILAICIVIVGAPLAIAITLNRAVLRVIGYGRSPLRTPLAVGGCALAVIVGVTVAASISILLLMQPIQDLLEALQEITPLQREPAEVVAINLVITLPAIVTALVVIGFIERFALRRLERALPPDDPEDPIDAP